jgi:hypothetical protein
MRTSGPLAETVGSVPLTKPNALPRPVSESPRVRRIGGPERSSRAGESANLMHQRPSNGTLADQKSSIIAHEGEPLILFELRKLPKELGR